MATGHGGPRPGSGRKPGKVGKAKIDIAERAATHGDAALRVLVNVMNDTRAPPAARISAANALLDRGYGKPMQAFEHAGKDGGPIQTEDVTRDAEAFTRKLLGLAARADGAGDGGADGSREGGA